MMNNGDRSPCQSDFQLLPDDILMTYVKEGYPDALAVLFDRYRRLVLSVAWQILRDRGEAEDLVQSVFLEILQSAAKFDSAKGTAKTWILQYAYHRSFNRKKYLQLRGIANCPKHFLPAHETAVSCCDSSFELVESERFVHEALASLNCRQRRILELAFYEGLSMREAAEITGQSFDTVRHHFYRAIGNLRSMIHRDSEGRISKSSAEKGGSSFVGTQIRATRQPLKSAKPLVHPSSLRRPRIGSNLRPGIGKAIFARV
ncbi:MAG TPA: sigma-70 family RNA polymerase sigma factor [Candidatus Polarisedimenticolia bacterium]|nr:sigma-70 family RNA polymerase sigma factor [Candidatus Polarisedimenticolia bacterium]